MLGVGEGLAWFAFIVGLAGALAYFLYVECLGLGFYAREPGEGPFPWLVNGVLLLLFAMQHSGLARISVKSLLARFIPAYLIRSFYVATSGGTLAILVIFWQPLPGDPLWHGPLVLAVVSLLGWIAVGVCSLRYDFASFFGFTQAATGSAEVPTPLRIEGPYRFVRHPLMVGLLVAIWAQPVMCVDLFVLNLGLTLYILIATRLEERDLVRQYGDEYVKYRRWVYAYFPVRVWPRSS